MVDDDGAEPAYPWWLVGVPAVLWLAIVADDVLLVPRVSGTLALGLLDEPAHLATTLIVLLAVATLAGVRRMAGPALWFAAGALVAGNAIDVDHVPALLGSDFLTEGTPRPYSHSLITVAALLLLARVARGRGRPLLAGAAVGVLLHLFRDLATAPVSLWWPFDSAPSSLPYPIYSVVVGGLALVPLVAALARRRRRAG